MKTCENPTLSTSFHKHILFSRVLYNSRCQYWRLIWLIHPRSPSTSTLSARSDIRAPFYWRFATNSAYKSQLTRFPPQNLTKHSTAFASSKILKQILAAKVKTRRKQSTMQRTRLFKQSHISPMFRHASWVWCVKHHQSSLSKLLHRHKYKNRCK